MENKQIISALAIAVIAGGIGFYSGTQYQASKVPAQQAGQRGNFGGGANGVQRGGGQNQGGGFQRQGGGAGDFASGQVVSKDDTSVTIKTRNGGTQIVFFSPSTTVDKSVSGVTSDLNVGQQVTANGKNNPDGSLAAQNIQIRPTQPQDTQN